MSLESHQSLSDLPILLPMVVWLDMSRLFPCGSGDLGRLVLTILLYKIVARKILWTGSCGAVTSTKPGLRIRRRNISDNDPDPSAL